MKLRKIQIFTGPKKELAIHIFFIENSQQPNCIISDELDVIFPGLPQTPTFTQIEGLVNEQRSIAYVHYYGSWYSGGVFNPATTEEAVKDSILALEEGSVEDVYAGQLVKVSTKKINLIGNSLGGYFVYKLKTNHKKILLSPLLPNSSNNNVVETLNKISASIISYKKSLLYCYRGIIDDSWDKFITKIIKISEKQKMDVDIYIGRKDSLITKEYILNCLDSAFKKIRIKEVNCGHDFFALYNGYIADTEGK